MPAAASRARCREHRVAVVPSTRRSGTIPPWRRARRTRRHNHHRLAHSTCGNCAVPLTSVSRRTTATASSAWASTPCGRGGSASPTSTPKSWARSWPRSATVGRRGAPGSGKNTSPPTRCATSSTPSHPTSWGRLGRRRRLTNESSWRVHPASSTTSDYACWRIGSGWAAGTSTTWEPTRPLRKLRRRRGRLESTCSCFRRRLTSTGCCSATWWRALRAALPNVRLAVGGPAFTLDRHWPADELLDPAELGLPGAPPPSDDAAS